MANPWKKLQGVFCLYKSAGVPLKHVSNTIVKNLVADLNEQYQPVKQNLVNIEGSTNGELKVNVSEKFAVHPLAIGPIYRKEDFKIYFSNYLADTSSGVCLAGLNKAVSVAQMIKYSRLIKVFKLTGILGQATLDFYHTGKIMERSTYSHVKIHHIEKILMTIQSSYQRRAMEYLGSSLNSQEMYEVLSAEGIVRPEWESIPLAYALKCVEFDPPSFTIEMACINEDEEFLTRIIHEIGLMLKTNAAVKQIRCIRFGPFTVDDSLVRKHWRLNYIIDNIDSLQPRIGNIRPKSPSLKTVDQIENR